MEFNKLVFAGLAVGCLAAAAGGSYLAVRQNQVASVASEAGETSEAHSLTRFTRITRVTRFTRGCRDRIRRRDFSGTGNARATRCARSGCTGTSNSRDVQCAGQLFTRFDS